MANRRREYKTRTVSGVIQQLCANKDCPVGWQNAVEFFSGSGERHVKCRKCRNDYHRHYLHGRQPLTATSVARQQRRALDDLRKAWPEPYAQFDECGTYGYEDDEPAWGQRPFDYDAAPAPRVYEEEGDDGLSGGDG